MSMSYQDPTDDDKSSKPIVHLTNLVALAEKGNSWNKGQCIPILTLKGPYKPCGYFYPAIRQGKWQIPSYLFAIMF